MKYLILVLSLCMSSYSCAMEVTKPQLKRSALIAIEGIDGSGKSTLARHLFNALSQKYPVNLTKEPGDTFVGKQIRAIIAQTPTEPISPKTEFLLFAADRAEHFSKHIKPLIEKNYIVISDRCADSSLAYQGYGRGLSKDNIKLVNSWAMNGSSPDLTIFVKVPVKVALERIAQRNEDPSVFEKEDFLKKVAQGFNEIYKPYTKSTAFEQVDESMQQALIVTNKNCVNLVIIDDVDFEEMHGNCIALITIDGKESEEKVAQKTITAVTRWIENHCK